MTRKGFLVGFLAGGWLATILIVLLPHLGLLSAQAEDPPGSANQPYGPGSGPGPGSTVNPSNSGFRPRGRINPGTGTSDSNHRSIALSASVGSGESVVYYFDTVAQRLCVYQYEPGKRGGLRLLAARHIDFDLRLVAYRDLSEKTPREMRAAYESSMRDAGRGGSGPARAGNVHPTKQVDLSGGIR